MPGDALARPARSSWDEGAPLSPPVAAARWSASYSASRMAAGVLVVFALGWISAALLVYTRGESSAAPARGGDAARIVMITFFPPSYTSHFRRGDDGWPSDKEGTSLYVDNWNCYASLHGYQLVTERVDWGSFPANDTGLSGFALEAVFAARDSEHKNAAGLAELKKPKPWSPKWMKVPLLRRHLPLADWALWFDGDALFISLPSSLNDVIRGLFDTDVVIFATGMQRVGEVLAQGCNCIFLVRNSPGGWWFINRWWALRARSQQWVDQGAWQQAIAEMLLRQRAAAFDAGDTEWPFGTSRRVHKDAWLLKKKPTPHLIPPHLFL